MTAGYLEIAPAARVRVWQLDALRGLAVLLMLLDHLALYLGADVVRLTAGRLAMPLFFLLAGHLAHRASRRLLLVPLTGLAVTLYAPFSGAFPLLLTLAAGAFLLSRIRHRPALLVLLIGYSLTLGANGYLSLYGNSYDPTALLALMALGALIPRHRLTAPLTALPAPLRAPLTALGRYPLTAYAGHLLVLVLLFGQP